ncbi:unnamed protein product [Amoebophrya sp. A120]|nr:unnamed protein product [Amoebophrya sp. A120]|eukprot:GSA120T00004055001.1
MFPTPDAKALFHSSTQWKKVHNILFGQKGKQLEEIVSTFVTAETSKSKPIGRFPRKPSQNLSHFAVLVHNWFNYNGSVPRINEIDTSAPHHQRCARSSARNREASSAAPDDRRNTGKKKVAPPRSSDPAVRRVAAGETRPDVARAPDVPPGLVAGPGVPASDEVKCYLQQPPPPPAAGLELPFWYKGQEIKDIADVAKYVL